MLNLVLPFLMLAILLAALLARPLKRSRFLPLPIALIVLGFLISEAWVYLGYDTGLRWELLRDLVFYLLLPVLVFEAAITIPIRAVRRDAWLVSALAIPLLLLATFATASLLITFLGAPMAQAYPLALLIGVMISATDPTRITSSSHDNAALRRVDRILQGEGLINDALTITLFGVLLSFIAMPLGAVDPLNIGGRILLGLVGSALLGATLGWLFDLAIAPADDNIVATSATIVLAFTGFWLSDHVFGLSGVVTTVAAGVTVAWRQRRHRDEADIAFAMDSWRMFSFCASAMLFFLVGMSITLQMFQDHWQAMLAGVAAGILARFLIVFAGAGPLSHVPWIETLSLKDQGLITLGGVRGAVAIALALSLPVTVDGWYLAQSIVYGVALFSLVVQGPLVILWGQHRKVSLASSQK